MGKMRIVANFVMIGQAVVCRPYVCMRAFVTRRCYSLSSHECAPKGQTEKMCL